MRYLKLYWNFLKNCIKREILYRFNFFVNILTVVFGYVANILFYFFVYNSGIESISGWSVYQVYVLLATVWIVDSLFGGVFFFNLIRIPMKVKNYELDGLLTKPVNPVFMLALRQFNLGLFSGVFFGIGFLIYAIKKGGLFVGVGEVLGYILLVLCAVLLLFCVLFIMVTFSLKFVRIQGLIQMFWTLMEVGKNPHSIYPTALKSIFTFLIPAIIIYNFPSQFLINDHFLENMNNGITILIAILITVLWLFIAIWYFKKSLKYYYNWKRASCIIQI